jgi:hypothetical protein
MQGQQSRLFNDEHIAPFHDMYVPPELRAGLPPLFEMEIRILSIGHTSTGGPCPYRVGHTTFTIPIKQVCDCPKSLELVMVLGQRYPRCTTNRCPVRAILAQGE